MKQATTRELYAYWNQIRGARLSPERADIDPAAIRALLGHTFMLEADGPGRFPFRLSGTWLNALFLRELRGSSFLGLWRNSERANVADLLLSVLDDAAPLVIGASAAPAEHLAVELELLLLPVRHHGKTHARILGSLAPASRSSWVGLIAADALTLRSARVLRAGEPAEAVHAQQAADAPVTRNIQLVVYNGGRRPDAAHCSFGGNRNLRPKT